MEAVYEALSDFIAGVMPRYLRKMETEDTSCPPVQKKDVEFGAVDVSRMQQKCIVSVMPDEESDGDGDLASWEKECSVTVTFIFSGAAYAVLVRRMVRYAAAFRRAVLGDPTLSGKVFDTEVGKRTFHPDRGTADKQMTASEVKLVIKTDEDIPVDEGEFFDE